MEYSVCDADSLLARFFNNAQVIFLSNYRHINLNFKANKSNIPVSYSKPYLAQTSAGLVLHFSFLGSERRGFNKADDATPPDSYGRVLILRWAWFTVWNIECKVHLGDVMSLGFDEFWMGIQLVPTLKEK